MSDETIPGRLENIQQRLDEGDARMAGLEDQVAENTALTKENTAITLEIKEILDAVRLGLKVLGGIGVAAKWIAAIAAGSAALWGIFHQGPPK